ncbi:MAG: PIN domain-containing protein [Acidimicrobiales bacterium]
MLLDTTYLIDAERSGEGLDEAIDDEDDVAIAAVTIAELRVGALLASGKRRKDRLAYVDDVIEAIPAIGYDLEVAAAHAQLLMAVRSQGRPRGAHDLIIAASALATDRVVVSADQGAFADLPGVTTRLHGSPS